MDLEVYKKTHLFYHKNHIKHYIIILISCQIKKHSKCHSVLQYVWPLVWQSTVDKQLCYPKSFFYLYESLSGYELNFKWLLLDFKRTDDIIYIILCRNRKRITIKLFFLLAVDNEKGISSDSDSGEFNANVNKVEYILKRFFLIQCNQIVLKCITNILKIGTFWESKLWNC